MKNTRIELFRSMNDEKLAIWFAETQLEWTKNICEDLGFKFNYTEDTVSEVAKENLAWLLETIEDV